MFVCDYHPWTLETEDHEFQVNLDYKVRPCLKKKKRLSKDRAEPTASPSKELMSPLYRQS